MIHWIDRRRSGVLLHISSLPGPMPCGTLGEEAHEFIDGLVKGGFSVWQFLPIGPTHGHGSPYESLSSFAGNEKLLDLREFVAEGWLPEDSYKAVIRGKLPSEAARWEATTGFQAQVEQDSALSREVNFFLAENAAWLDDYALFAALKKAHGDLAWWQWPKSLRKRQPKALAQANRDFSDLIHQIQFEQFMFARQWQALKDHAETRGVLLFGDLPIYVAHDSADVWTNKQLFTINDTGLCEEVSGVPPDYFSKNGQRWGNPLYNWDKLEEDGFDWWVKRIQAQLKRMDLLRIDHFCGLQAYWAIPGDRQDGHIGEWRDAPGEKLLGALLQQLGKLPLIAEDLGLLINEVRPLRKHFGLPGMEVLQFAFGGDENNPYLPDHHEADSVVYTGTHDNDTTLGWHQSLDEGARSHLAKYMGHSDEGMPWPLIRMALESVSELAVVPMQDLLSLDSRARLNIPGTVDGNWSWRLSVSQITQDIWDKAQDLNLNCGR